MNDYYTETIVWIALCIIVGVIARNKGKSFILFFLLSCFLSPIIGGIIVLIVKRSVPEQTQKNSYQQYGQPSGDEGYDDYEVDYIGEAEAIKRYKELLDK